MIHHTNATTTELKLQDSRLDHGVWISTPIVISIGAASGTLIAKVFGEATARETSKAS